MTESTKAADLRNLGFEHYHHMGKDPLLAPPGECLFMSFTGILEITFATDETGQIWVNPRASVDLTGWGFTPLEEFVKKNLAPPDNKPIN